MKNKRKNKHHVDLPKGYEVSDPNICVGDTRVAMRPIGPKLPKSFNIFNDLHTKAWHDHKLKDASVALRELIVLRDIYNDGWVANYGTREVKYIIRHYKDEVSLSKSCGFSCPLIFKTAKLRDHFLKHQYERILRAKLLLS